MQTRRVLPVLALGLVLTVSTVVAQDDQAPLDEPATGVAEPSEVVEQLIHARHGASHLDGPEVLGTLKSYQADVPTYRDLLLDKISDEAISSIGGDVHKLRPALNAASLLMHHDDGDTFDLAHTRYSELVEQRRGKEQMLDDISQGLEAPLEQEQREMILALRDEVSALIRIELALQRGFALKRDTRLAEDLLERLPDERNVIVIWAGIDYLRDTQAEHPEVEALLESFALDHERPSVRSYAQAQPPREE